LQINSKFWKVLSSQTVVRILEGRVVAQVSRVVQAEKDQNQGGEATAGAEVVLKAEGKEEEQGAEAEAEAILEIKDGAIQKGVENGVAAEVGVMIEIEEEELIAEVEAGKGEGAKKERQITSLHQTAALLLLPNQQNRNLTRMTTIITITKTMEKKITSTNHHRRKFDFSHDFS